MNCSQGGQSPYRDARGVVIADAAAVARILAEREAEYAILGAVVGAILATLVMEKVFLRKSPLRLKCRNATLNMP